MANSLEDNWREDVLFELEQVLQVYDFYQGQIAACDEKLKAYMEALPSREGMDGAEEVPGRCWKPGRRRKNQPNFDLRTELKRALGVM